SVLSVPVAARVGIPEETTCSSVATSLPPQYLPSKTPVISTAANTGNSHTGSFDEGLLTSFETG
ncbi:hypothetical protein, partial [Shewanella sp. CAL98-MNA-CIBAN-0140]|uniref:hypothetical protein n=1 Tax=Shewanella sp. CAL98-MNA-CIBAN-0140 TaxID=3140462 RepID=UPI00331B0927